MYQILSEISQFLSTPFFNIVNQTKQMPLLAAVILGLIGALTPCQLTGNIGAITFYGSRSIQTRHQWVEIGFFILGKIVVFSILGLAFWGLGRSFQEVLPEFFSLTRKFIGPLLILIGLVFLGIIKFHWLDRITARLPKWERDGKVGSFLMGVSFSLGFCPTMFSLFFFSLMPLVLSTPYGAILPPVFAIGTSVPVLVFAGIITYIGLDGALMKKSRKLGNAVQKTAGVLFILLGLLDTITYWG
ncbi:sulfite exporter TauE/SafE family protein [Bacillus sp. B15-48]|uniref:urease accessory protein UreH domain-containing protein n=1 Tax=Bacillus sp. B15-48 TaxID=1548601 RepID=UPI00193EE8CA|nr:sulfite exporter TauE/SafE family protein [Bacillus sp. B15-48]MBM4764622.1 sulfite exporter TauE/SafE family protein [Bacillus sp. B15-48]